jgi:hypothetical protein
MSVFAAFVDYRSLQGMISAGVLLLQAMISLGCLVDNMHSVRITITLSIGGISSFLCAVFLLGGNVVINPTTGRSELPDPVMSGFYVSAGVLGASIAVLLILMKIIHAPFAGSAVALAAFNVNCFLLGSLELRTLAIFAGICALVIPMYFLYGVNHSTLNNTQIAN